MLSRLLTEHDHLQKTLNLLEMQFLDLCRGRGPDFAMMLSIVAYIQEFPEQAHHPLEDVAFSALIERGGEGAKLARDLIANHTEMEGITRKLRGSLELIAGGDRSEEEDLKRVLSMFISRQRQHLYIEEMRIYPLLKKVITKQDWENIESIVPLADDPVFGERTRSDYERLYREIESRSS
jgi:hemerythrin-like domain-containing protein